MEINLLEIVAAIINFIILYFILKKFFFDKVTKVIDDRCNEVNSTIERAKEQEAQGKKFQEENRALLAESKQKGKEIVEKYKRKAEDVSKDIIDNAHKEAAEIVQRARKDSEREKAKLKDEMKNEAVELSVLMSSKALEKTIDEEEHRKLISDFIIKVGD